MALVTPSKYFLQRNIGGRLVGAPTQETVHGLFSGDPVLVWNRDQVGNRLAVSSYGDGLSLLHDLEKFG